MSIAGSGWKTEIKRVNENPGDFDVYYSPFRRDGTPPVAVGVKSDRDWYLDQYRYSVELTALADRGTVNAMINDAEGMALGRINFDDALMPFDIWQVARLEGANIWRNPATGAHHPH